MSNTALSIYNAFFNSPFFAICLCVITYRIGTAIHDRYKLVILNPLLVATVLIIGFLLAAHIPYNSFKKGGDLMLLFLGPATAVLALAIYNQRKVLKRNLIPVIAGTCAGALTSVLSVYLLGKAFHLDTVILHSMLPKSVTTPIALSLSSDIGGIPAVSMCAIIMTGMTGAIMAPLLIRLLHITSPIAAGIGIGTCSHAIGTAAALEMGEVYGAMSSVAIGCAGLATTVIFIFL